MTETKGERTVEEEVREVIEAVGDPSFLLAELSRTRKELSEAREHLENVMGFFDNPVTRRLVGGDLCDEARENARRYLEGT